MQIEQDYRSKKEVDFINLYKGSGYRKIFFYDDKKRSCFNKIFTYY